MKIIEKSKSSRGGFKGLETCTGAYWGSSLYYTYDTFNTSNITDTRQTQTVALYFHCWGLSMYVLYFLVI